MNQKIRKVIDEIERTKAKILELQTLLPELERKRIDMENTEIIKLVRSADISAAELPAFIEALKAPKVPAPNSDGLGQHGAGHPTAGGVTNSSEAITPTQPVHFAPDDEDNFNAQPLSDD